MRLRPAVLRRFLVTMMEPAQPPAKRARPPDVLGDEMKRYEVETCAAAVNTALPVVVRLDGHCFHTYTKGFDRPYSTRIHEAMVGTASDLLDHFGAVTSYTESDEISRLHAAD